MVLKHLHLMGLAACLTLAAACGSGHVSSASAPASRDDKIDNLYNDVTLKIEGRNEFSVKSAWDEMTFSKEGFSLRTGRSDYTTGRWNELDGNDSVAALRLEKATAAVQILVERLHSFDHRKARALLPPAQDLLASLKRLAAGSDNAGVKDAVKDVLDEL